MRKYAVIVAGGSGLRMGTQLPKQFLLLQGMPVLWHTLKVFLKAYEDLEILLVLPSAHIERGRKLAQETSAPQRIHLIAGGDSRFQSVKNGLHEIDRGESAIIFVHDGVRCLLTTDLIHRCYAEAVAQGSAIPVINSKDSVRLVTASGSESIDRTLVKLVQTPQTFRSEILLSSYSADYRETFTDEATVVEASGHKINLVEGEPNNLKITTPEDLLIADKFLKPGGAA